jgi:hypothetical protein
MRKVVVVVVVWWRWGWLVVVLHHNRIQGHTDIHEDRLHYRNLLLKKAEANIHIEAYSPA